MNPRRPHPAYFEFLSLQVGVTLVGAVLLLVLGRWLVGALLFVAVAVEVAVLLQYRRRVNRW